MSGYLSGLIKPATDSVPTLIRWYFSLPAGLSEVTVNPMNPHMRAHVCLCADTGSHVPVCARAIPSLLSNNSCIPAMHPSLQQKVCLVDGFFCFPAESPPGKTIDRLLCRSRAFVFFHEKLSEITISCCVIVEINSFTSTRLVLFD